MSHSGIRCSETKVLSRPNMGDIFFIFSAAAGDLG